MAKVVSTRAAGSGTGSRAGFTIIELLVVVGIMMLLTAVLLAGISHVKKTAANAKAQDLVSNVATAFNQVLQNDRNWSGRLIRASQAGEPVVDSEACQTLIRHKVYSLSYKKRSDGTYELTGVDRFGIVDPWTAQFLKSHPSAGIGTKVPGGGTVKDHILRFAIDDDYDGICEVRIEGASLRVRASVAVWSCGQNGKFESYSSVGRVEGSDDLFSWTPGQVVK